MKDMKLNFGCAWDLRPKSESWVNVDREEIGRILKLRKLHKLRDPEDFTYIKWDLNKFPYPFEDNTFDEVIIYHVLEHLEDVVKVMNELWRICKKDAIIDLKLPYFSGTLANTDPTYKHRFSYRTFEHFEFGADYFDMMNKANFKIVSRKIVFSDSKFLRVFNFIPNIYPKVYERFFAYILPSQSLQVKLKVVKDDNNK